MPHVRMEMLPQGFARIVFDQPDSKANVLSPEMWLDLEAAVDQVAASPAKGLILASAKPGIFIAGADLKLLGQAKPKDPEVLAFLQQGLRVLHKLEELSIPTVAYIQGAALGGGLEVALACDVICYEDRPKTQIGFPEVNLGLIPGWGGTQRLPRWVDLIEANQMIRTAAMLNPEQAEAKHLGFRIGAEDQLFDVLGKIEVEKFRVSKLMPIMSNQRLVLPPNPLDEPAAVREVTPLLIHGTRMSLYEGIEMESRAFMRLAGTEESKRKIAEFFASRKK